MERNKGSKKPARLSGGWGMTEREKKMEGVQIYEIKVCEIKKPLTA